LKIRRRSYELEWLAVLFEIADDDETYTCGITLEQLDPDRGNLTSGDQGLAKFDSLHDEIWHCQLISLQR